MTYRDDRAQTTPSGPWLTPTARGPLEATRCPGIMASYLIKPGHKIHDHEDDEGALAATRGLETSVMPIGTVRFADPPWG